MKKILMIVTAVMTVNSGLAAEGFTPPKGCVENTIDDYNSIFVCKDVQYMIEYKPLSMGGKGVEKITLVSNGKPLVIKDNK